MAELDIRDNNENVVIDTIRFAEDDVVSRKGVIDEEIIYIASDNAACDAETDENVAYIFIRDIPNLIKALQKAQEIWSASE